MNVARQVLRDVEEAVFYKRELGIYPKNIEKFIMNLDTLMYDKLENSPLIGTSLSYRLDVSTNIRYLMEDDYTLFYDVQDNEKK
ncbi:MULTISPECIES: type II toxin-antitoxin system RelE/ParE family toxin [Enterococcus]|uniref:type II toxin-antitoxin system RelE/ParE family toxin n=1 Tax=Enterococcus TaxID=1350 RepID=UPI0003A64A25|nr:MULTISPECIES: type II toxin-antitoxin system RelE/ParE family toxin [Enterococcus]UXK05289.1 type II toxin-antitoxin system RelE/ParE family toxin [Enterococcus raffinosus]